MNVEHLQKGTPMNLRSSVSIAIIALALLFAFAAVSVLADNGNITKFSYVGFDPSKGDVFSWDTVADGGEIRMGIRGGGISNVWLRLRIFTVSHEGGTTTVGVAPLKTYGEPMEYRVKVGNSAWSETISLTFD